MKRFFCTYFDHNYLPRGLTLFQSIKKNCTHFELFVLALDKKTEHYLHDKNYTEITIISLEEYKAYFQVDETKFKSHKEFFFSVTPNINLYLLQQYPQIDILWYIDADTCFYNNIELLYQELENASIGICPHRSSGFYNLVSSNYGIYNVGVNAFRNDQEGIACLKDWKYDCETWNYDNPNNKLSFFSDQIFLDDWLERYENIKIIKHLGINAAPWNMMHNRLSIKNNHFFVNNQPLILFHFASLKKIDTHLWTATSARFFTSIRGNLSTLYINYIKSLESHGLSNKAVADLGFDASKVKENLKYLLKIFFTEKVKTNENQASRNI